MSRRSVEQWRRDVFRASAVSANVRLLLIYMADHMRERDKHVSIPRVQMAKALGWSEQRVSERLREAVDRGFLSPKSPGYRGHTAEYQGTWPDEPMTKSVRENRTLSRDQISGRINGGKRPRNTDATSRADRFSGSSDRNVGIDSEARRTEVESRLTACEAHGWADCADRDCLDAESRRTAS